MAGEALPWLLKRIEDTLNENDKLLRNHRLMSQDAFRSSWSCIIPRRGVTAVMIKVQTLDINARACTLCKRWGKVHNARPIWIIIEPFLAWLVCT